jgi:hypothetical protein
VSDTPEEQVLPAHRIALRMAVLGSGGGLVGGSAGVLVAVLGGKLRTDGAGAGLLLILALAVLAAGVYSALLVLAEEVARGVPRQRRLLVVGGVGLGSVLLAGGTVLWVVVVVVQGEGVEGGVRLLGFHLRQVVEFPGSYLSGVLMGLAPTLGISAPRLGAVPWIRREVHARWASPLLGAVGGLVAVSLLWLIDSGGSRELPLWAVAMFAAVPAAIALGLEAGGVAERRLLDWWRRRLDDQAEA